MPLATEVDSDVALSEDFRISMNATEPGGSWPVTRTVAHEKPLYSQALRVAVSSKELWVELHAHEGTVSKPPGHIP